jgi:hypothetical protein
MNSSDELGCPVILLSGHNWHVYMDEPKVAPVIDIEVTPLTTFPNPASLKIPAVYCP